MLKAHCREIFCFTLTQTATAGMRACRPTAVTPCGGETMRADAGIAPTVTMPFPVGRGALTPPPGRHPPCGAPVGVGVSDDPCPRPAGKNRPGNDTHPTNSISVYSVLPLKKRRRPSRVAAPVVMLLVIPDDQQQAPVVQHRNRIVDLHTVGWGHMRKHCAL